MVERASLQRVAASVTPLKIPGSKDNLLISSLVPHATKAFAFRLPMEVVKILERRINRRPNRWATVNEYLKDRIVYDVMRKR